MNIGPIELRTPFVQAGLAGYSDRAMRLVARRRGCPYAVTEALLDVIMLNGGEGLRRSIDINDEDHPIAGQIMGSEPGTMSKAACLLHQAGYDVIDLNFACPVKKIKDKARGGHMLLDIERAKSIPKTVRDPLPAATPPTCRPAPRARRKPRRRAAGAARSTIHQKPPIGLTSWSRRRSPTVTARSAFTAER